ncbi:MAG: DoxX family protein [Thermoguttaceae bacterium]
MAAVVLLVALRMSIGCHFLYEGTWKIKNADKFSAKPFLTMAKGPAAPLFYAMVPDLDGRERLKFETNEDGNRVFEGESFTSTWDKLREGTVGKYALDEKQQKQAADIFLLYSTGLEQYFKENGEDIVAHFGSLDRFEAMKAAGTDGSDYKKERIWDEQQKLRGEVGKWLGAIDKMGEDYQSALWMGVLSPEQRAQGDLPVATTFGDFLDFAVTYGLTAIGFCLMLGLCTRFACLGGAAFLISVLLTQPPWPTIYPHAPPVAGHAMVIDKNFIEMVALLLLASTAVGRWGGLDYFVENYVIGLWNSSKKKQKNAGGN